MLGAFIPETPGDIVGIRIKNPGIAQDAQELIRGSEELVIDVLSYADPRHQIDVSEPCFVND